MLDPRPAEVALFLSATMLRPDYRGTPTAGKRFGYGARGPAGLRPPGLGGPIALLTPAMLSRAEETDVDVIRSRPDTSPGSADRFTGTVWIDPIAVASGPSRLHSNSAHFAPGARTAWHVHPYGQILHVLEGGGRVQARGGPVHEVRAGDTIVTPAGEWHWHGAAPRTFMTHLGMQETDETHDTEWGDHVSDAEYLAPPG